ncbi:glycosyltransferase family 2 protein [Candidatus Falkowbacteria bacterium]|nr:glycosyltransferase family 2 protein [Candidatus Falkowbacteria bacterium]NCT54963.1 glycosyltransferase family 2 protein [Candidatus Falkowbacteria bacterium]
MHYSIIIINYKTQELSANCIASLLALKNQEDFEIILVDNASGDNSLEFLEKEFEGKIKIIPSLVNLGFGGGNNLGAKEAKGEFLLFLNSDTLVKEDIFKSALDIFRQDEKIGLISPLLMTEEGLEQKDAYGPWPNLKNLIFKRTNNYPDWLSGCALFIRKSLFEELKGFDENFFLYFEDVDLCFRASKLGYKVKVDRNSKVIHLGGRSLKDNRQRKNSYYKSQDYYFKKHYGLISQIIMRILRLPVKVWKMR